MSTTTKPQAATKPKEADSYSLLDKEITQVRTWKEFLDLWKSTTNYMELIGLLHYGFKVPESFREAPCYQERIIFYLSIADGWNHRISLTKQDDPVFAWSGQAEQILPHSVMREEVAKKAFKILCDQAFKSGSGYFNHIPNWSVRALHPDTFQKILWFFRPDRHGDIFNMPPKEDDERRYRLVKDFLRVLCSMPFSADFVADEMKRYLDTEKVQEQLENCFPSIMHILQRLGMLASFPMNQLWKSLSYRAAHEDRFVSAWTDYVMNKELDFPPSAGGRRKPTSLEEACYGNFAHPLLGYLQMSKLRKAFDTTIKT